MLVAVLAGAGVGAAIDLRTRRIPNVVTISTAAAGMALAILGATGVTPLSSLAGLLLGLALLMPGYAIGATGAGDVKLMAAVGAIVGLERILVALAATAIVGGVFAVAIALWRGRLLSTLDGTSRLLRAPAETRSQIESAGPLSRFSYGPAIAAGGVLAVWLVR